MVKTLGRLETSPQLHGFAPQVRERVVAVPTGLPWRVPGEPGKSREVPGGRNSIGSHFRRHFFQRGVTTLPVEKVGFAPFQNMLVVVCTGIQDDDALQ